MRIILVRHGHPDYANDCLTPLGHLQAAAAAQRLKEEGIQKIYSSTCGRAMETARHTADVLGLAVEGMDAFREINWGSVDGSPMPYQGHPWDTADHMTATNQSLLDPDWAVTPPFAGNRVVECVRKVAAAADEWLLSLGYQREGLYYRVLKPAYDTVALFGHGGETAALLTHLFNVPFPFFCSAMGPDYTGIVVLTLPDAADGLVPVRFALVNDTKHIQGLRTENVFNR
ncbi:MAG: histidine phosphatase family protein [Clostridiales bacterium]|nr:histidine phosphatase family protein [Clostridiales bacterium]